MGKKIIIGIWAVIFIIIFLIAAYMKSINKNTQAPVEPSPKIEITITPVRSQSLRISSVSPQEDLTKTYLPITQLKLSFNNKVAIEDLFVNISPPAEYYLKKGADDKSIIISPRHSWRIGVTEFEIILKTNNASNPNNSFRYKIQTRYPQVSNPDLNL